MAYSRPSLQTLITRAIGDISSRTQGSAFIKRSVERVFGYVWAGLAHGLYGNLEWNAKQISPTTCDLAMLQAFGVWLKIPRLGATTSTGDAEFTGTNGTELPIDTVLQDDEGNTFTVVVAGTVSGGTVTVTVEADDAGVAGNLEAGATLSLVSPIAGIDDDGEVGEDGLSGGTDIEDPEDYRARILDGLRVPPSGGGPGDYETWAKEVAGVTRAWEFGKRMGVGTVSIGFVMDDRDDIIPLSGDVDDVQAYIDSVMPLDMRAAYVVAPIALPVDMTIALSPNTSDVRAQVTAELEDLFSTTDLETALPQSKIDEAISTASGEDDHEITVITSLEPGTWELLTLGDITFTAL